MAEHEYLYAYPDKNCEKKKGETLPYKSAYLNEDEPLATVPESGCDTLKKIFVNSVEEFNSNPCLGKRPVVDHTEKGEAVFGKYEFNTYQETYEASLNLAKSLNNLELYCKPKVAGANYKLIGIYAKN